MKIFLSILFRIFLTNNFIEMNFFEILGWIGNLVLSIGVIPQVYKTYKTRDVESFSWSFLLMWAFGVLFTFVYIMQGDIVKGDYQYPLWLNYLVNIIATGYLVFAKFKYQNKEK